MQQPTEKPLKVYLTDLCKFTILVLACLSRRFTLETAYWYGLVLLSQLKISFSLSDSKLKFKDEYSKLKFKDEGKRQNLPTPSMFTHYKGVLSSSLTRRQANAAELATQVCYSVFYVELTQSISVTNVCKR